MILLKKIIKKPILWIAVALLAIFIFLYITGFRITYAPNLKNDWDAISACAGWASVLLSFAAICAAIYVPYKVANDQNKISLFEKRYEVVVTVEKMFGEVDSIKRRMSIIFSKNSTKKLSFEIINKWRISISETLKDVNGQYDYLFYDEVRDIIKYIYLSLLDIDDKLVQLDTLLRQEANSDKSDVEWNNSIMSNSNINALKELILQQCNTDLSLKTRFSVGVGKHMDLRNL